MFFIDGGKILIPLVQGKLIEYLVVNKVITTLNGYLVHARAKILSAYM